MFIVGTFSNHWLHFEIFNIRSYDVYVKCAAVSTCQSAYYLVDLYSACAVLCKIICGPELRRRHRFDPLASQ